MDVTSVAEEVAKPRKNIPLAIILSVICVTVIYAIVLIATVGVLPGDKLSHSLTPIADAAALIIGTPGYVAVTIAACLAFLTTANAGIMAASRYPLALSRDELIPRFLGKVNHKYKTPVVSISITCILIILSLTLNLDTLVTVASTVILTMYILVNIAVIILRYSKIQNYKPSFRVPLFPWIQIVSIIIFSFLICYMGLEE